MVPTMEGKNHIGRPLSNVEPNVACRRSLLDDRQHVSRGTTARLDPDP